MPNIIINSDTSNLKDTFKKLIPKTTEMKYLIGYFYFSAVPELYDELIQKEDLKIKILVGLKTDSIISSSLTSFYDNDREEYIERLEENFNSDSTDTQDFHIQFKDFIKWVETGKIVIRKTREPNHSKLYIFKYDETGPTPNRFITGSSNLTRAGLFGQDEFNVEVVSNNDEREAEEYFDRLWDDAIELTEDPHYKDKIIEKLQRSTQGRDVSPFDAYVYILQQFLSIESEDADTKGNLAAIMDEAGYTPYKYQTDAVREALRKIEAYNGVILGDVVGLGKSIIASLIARQLQGETLILCPPGLTGDINTYGWEYYSEKFKIHAKVESASWPNIKKINETGKYAHYDNVIIDEAHRFRNSVTETYGHLKNICRGKRVILLTATPFNNKPWDIHNLLALFLHTKHITTESSRTMFDDFRKANEIVDLIGSVIKNKDSQDPKDIEEREKNFKKLHKNNICVSDTGKESIKKLNEELRKIGNKIKNNISEYIIRRNRLDLLKNLDYIKDFPSEPFSKIEDPKEGIYLLDDDVSKFYDDILEKYFAKDGIFTGAIYRPAFYETKEIKGEDTEKLAQQRQGQLYNFMKRVLVKRLESSFGAFEKSIDKFCENHERIIEFVRSKKYYILNRKFMSDYADAGEEEILSLLDEMIDEKGKDFDTYVFTEKGLEDFLRDAENDKEMFFEIKAKITSLSMVQKDTKFDELVNIINELQAKEPDKKIIVFSEFADTVEHLKTKFKGIKRDDIIYATGGDKKSKFELIEKEFDASYKPSELDITYPTKEKPKNIIVCTDVLSEGFNLNRAGIVINYDIPWNPVRVIQRLGRVNRISKKVFESISIYNFFPGEKGKNVVKTEAIAKRKMLLIHNILGEDAKIFSPEEIPSESELYSRLTKIPEDTEEESFYTKVLNIYKSIESDPKGKETIEDIKDMPLRVKTGKIGKENEVLLFMIKNDLYIRVINTDTDTEFSEYKFNEEILDKIKCAYGTHKEPLSQAFWDNYPTLKSVIKPEAETLSTRSQALTAFNNLQSIKYYIERQGSNHPLEKHLPFIRVLIKDIQSFGSLTNSDYKRIIDWEKCLKSEKYDDLETEIGKFYIYLGKDSYIRSITNPKEFETKIIVGYENRIGE